MTPDLQDARQQHTATGWIAHAHPVRHHGGLPGLFPASGLRFRTARTTAMPDRHRYPENHTSTPKA
jgi:hypothetical protein